MRLPDDAAQDFAMRLRRQGGNTGSVNPNMGPYGRPQGNGGINPGGMYGGSSPEGGPGSFNQGAWDRSNGGINPGMGGNTFQPYAWPKKWKPFGGPGESINRDFGNINPNMGPYGRSRGNGGINPGGMYGGYNPEGGPGSFNQGAWDRSNNKINPGMGQSYFHPYARPKKWELFGGPDESINRDFDGINPNMGPYGRPRGNGGINPGGRYGGYPPEGGPNGPPRPPWDENPSDPGGNLFPRPGNRGPIPGPMPIPRWDPNQNPPAQGFDYAGFKQSQDSQNRWLDMMRGMGPQLPTENPIFPEPEPPTPTTAFKPW